MLDYNAGSLELTAVAAKERIADAFPQCIFDFDIVGTDCSTLLSLGLGKSDHAAVDLILQGYNRKTGFVPLFGKNAMIALSSSSFCYYR